MERARLDRSARLPDGRELGYAEYGDVDGAPVLYFHGFPGSRLDWLLFDQPAVAESGARVIAVDRPGYGLSDTSPKRTMADWPADVAGLADALGVERFAVLGVSGGGPYALACASAIPDRLAAVGVVAGMGPADAPGMREGTSWRIPGTPRLLRKPLLSLMRMGVRQAPEKFVARSKDALSDVDAALLGEPAMAEAYVATLSEAMRRGTAGAAVDAALYARPWGFALEEIRVAVHVWHGELDANVPVSVGRHVADRISGCRGSFLDDEGHLTLPKNHIGRILQSLVNAGTP